MRLRSLLLAAACAVALVYAPGARAGTANGYTTATPIPSSFCSFTLASSTALVTNCATGMAAAANALCIFGTVTGANVNWRDDGTAATATVGSGGQQITNGSPFWYCGQLSTLRFIQQSATATLSVSFYK